MSATICAGDLRELTALQVRIDYHVGFAELAREQRKFAVAAEHLKSAFVLFSALKRLEKAIRLYSNDTVLS